MDVVGLSGQSSASWLGWSPLPPHQCRTSPLGDDLCPCCGPLRLPHQWIQRDLYPLLLFSGQECSHEWIPGWFLGVRLRAYQQLEMDKVGIVVVWEEPIFVFGETAVRCCFLRG